jgi:di/tricarboxylate transporter
MGAAGYRFGDYWRLGAVTMIVFFVVSVLVVPVFWPF